MIRTLCVLIGVAAVVATVDLAHKALSNVVVLHDRSTLYLAGGAAASLAWAGLITLTRSLSIALTAGVLLGGAAGNLASAALWPGVPDPLLAGGLAFNVADVAVALGLVLLIPATLVFAVRNRERLFEPVLYGRSR